MKLSIVIPAFNESRHISTCLRSVYKALGENAKAGFASEVIVVDNNSTDATADLAREVGARVVFEPINQISRARNAGARTATGDWLLFIDADSWLHAESLADLIAAMATGKLVGGGSLVGLEPAPLLARCLITSWNLLSVLVKWAAGSFLFCRADAFREVGGFSENLYAAEEVELSNKLKRWAKGRGLNFRILTAHPHISSGRKFYLYSRRELAGHLMRSALFPWSTLRSRKRLGYFYDGRR